MIMTFLIGLIAVIGIITIMPIIKLSASWLKNYISKRQEKNKNHKIVLADISKIVSEEMEKRIHKADEIPMSELERMCSESPYIAAEVEEMTGEISNYEGINPREVDENVKELMNKYDGIIVFGG